MDDTFLNYHHSYECRMSETTGSSSFFIENDRCNRCVLHHPL